MKITLSKEVKSSLSELTINCIQIEHPGTAKGLPELSSMTLIDKEVAQYAQFRKKIAGNKLLAVERLHKIQTTELLPDPDPLTNLIIKASHTTNIPITVFSLDELSNTVNLRFSGANEYLELSKERLALSKGSLVAESRGKLIGLFGITSSVHGKLTGLDASVVILSFGVSKSTSKKSQALVQSLASMISQTPNYRI